MKKETQSPSWWTTRWIALLVAFALVAAACGSGNDDDEGGEAPAPQATEAAPAPEPAETDGEAEPAPAESEPDESAPAPTQEPAETEAPAPEEEPEATPEPIVLTDSFRGVTSEAILIGHSSIDFEKLNADFGLDVPYQNFGPPFLALVDWYNEQGGVLGRRLEVVSELFLPVGPTTAEAACLKLTEDVQVFAVLNGFAGPGAEQVNTCVTELHDTILVGGLPNPEQAAAAGGLWVSPQMSLERRNTAMVSILEQTGRIDDLSPVMIIGAHPEQQSLVDGIAEELRAAGAEVPVVGVVTTTGDQFATQVEMDVYVERARSDGVVSILLAGEDNYRNTHLWNTAPEFVYLIGNGDRLADWQREPPDGLQSVTSVLTARGGPSPMEDPRILHCIDVIENALGIEVLPLEELGEDDIQHWAGMLNACRDLALFVQIAEAAGPDLTNEAWVAALDNVPDISVPGVEFASLSSEKVDAADELFLVEYDFDARAFIELAGPIDVG
ncbi:MAG: ABC transporter substrate-binding protein [Acidimicrobiia bacterium]|nr:ABC transporter substrate-binding protein [Acidimicrobiia bacterium]MCY4432783.1 ABC transporter substrate-binding protein [bacterium]